jgi:hypothetical protein
MAYYDAFMLVSPAMLGLASGGLAVQISPSRFPLERAGQLAARYSLDTGLSCFLGTLTMSRSTRRSTSGDSIVPTRAITG